ncbi:MAG TPA: hypothetical protein PKD16_14125 [Saprospiraceae bacterium]|jgi:hypothetical protein|nr:hypothetical protein [Saprospiraceae bacterium]HMT71299.1 hypothetical protein [Saprospiraceae bacterium]
MKFQIFTFFIVFFYNIVNAQSISIGFGPVFTHTNQKVKLVNSQEDFQNTDYQFVINYEHFLKNTRYSFFGTFSKFDGYTWIKFREGSVIAPDGFPTLGVGFSGVNITKFELGGVYNCFDLKKWYFFKPFISLGLQFSNINEWEFWADLEPIDGPEYVELEPVLIESNKTTQIVPSIGLKTGVVLWNRIELGLTVQGVLGFKSYQNMYFKYSYKGVPQETAVFEANGTGIYTALSIGYRFAKQGK